MKAPPAVAAALLLLPGLPLLHLPSRLHAQDQADRLLRLHRTLAAIERDAIWPSFQPDSIPVLYLIPGRGTLLAGWGGELPQGFERLPGAREHGWRPEAARGAASTSVELDGRSAAQVVVDTAAPDATLLALAVHEAFHAFSGQARRPGRRFGQGENSFLVASYPVFDAGNETGVALEGRILAAALAARSDDEARSLAAQFLAVRSARQRALPSDLATFESLAELNEGLAEYAGLRAVALLAPRTGWTPDAERMRADLLGRLNDLIGAPERSLRLRYYATGPGLALLLDRLAAKDWKQTLVDSNRTLQDQLAYSVGYYDAERRIAAEARARHDWRAVRDEAARIVTSLLALRRAQVDSVLAAPGILLTIDAQAIGGGIGLCGIDPQNLLQASQGVLLHTRWLRPCAGASLQGEFNTRVVHDQDAGTLRAVIGAEHEVAITAGGQPIPLEDAAARVVTGLTIASPGATLRSARAEVTRDGRAIRVRLLPPA